MGPKLFNYGLKTKHEIRKNKNNKYKYYGDKEKQDK